MNNFVQKIVIEKKKCDYLAMTPTRRAKQKKTTTDHVFVIMHFRNILRFAQHVGDVLPAEETRPAVSVADGLGQQF